MKKSKLRNEDVIEKKRTEYEAKIPKDQLLIPKKLARQKELKPEKKVTTKQMQNRKVLLSCFVVLMFAVIIFVLLTVLTSSSHFMDPVVYYNKAIVEQDESQLTYVLPKEILDTDKISAKQILSELREQGTKLGGTDFTIVEYLVEKKALETAEVEKMQLSLKDSFAVDLKITKAYKVILDTTFKSEKTSKTVREELYVYQVNNVWYWYTLDLNRNFSGA